MPAVKPTAPPSEPADKLITPVTEPAQKPASRCVVVVDQDLPAGHAANAAAVLALTLGTRVGGLVGADLVDGSGFAHPGLIPIGLPVLAAPAATIAEIRARALDLGATVVDFPSDGQRTTDYQEFRRRVAGVPTAQLDYVGAALHGPRKVINKLVGSLPLLK